ncbi:hypothetical protein C6P46_004614 [Rhodotorula mucilaginosa]|uniref:Uncharacterized protein n=1 Tax=Rhodotorula mucilaginosa TaxID=5537 RepID=A0A9P6W210_RHOMI|nr:hypothetical protein C6P46_004614 [Rhodotorula mucilaginosa]
MSSSPSAAGASANNPAPATPTWLPGARVKSPRLRQGVKTANQLYLHAARKTTPIRENHAAVTLANDPAPSREKLVRYPPPPGPSETEFVLGEMIHSNTPFQAIFDNDDNKEEDAEVGGAASHRFRGGLTDGGKEEEEDDEDKLESETEDEEPEPEPAPVGRKAQLATSIRVAMKTDWVPLAKAGGYKVALFFQRKAFLSCLFSDMGVTVRIGQYGKPWQHAEPYPAFYLTSPPGVNPDPRIWFNVPKHMLLTVGNNGHHLVRPQAGPYIVARLRKFREDLIVAYSDPQTRAVSMRSTWIPQQSQVPKLSTAGLLLRDLAVVGQWRREFGLDGGGPDRVNVVELLTSAQHHGVPVQLLTHATGCLLPFQPPKKPSNLDDRDALERFASPSPGVVATTAQLRLELLASFKSLDSEGALAPDLLDAICQQAQRSWERINKRSAQNDVEEQALSVFDELVAPRLDSQQLACWREAIDPPPAPVSNSGSASTPAELPVETHAELLLAVHEHCAGVAYSLTNAFQVLLVDHLCVVKALRRLQEPSDNGEDASIQHESRRDHLSKAAVSADARIPTAHVPFAPLNPNALAPMRKRSLSSGTDAVSAHAEPTMATAPKRQRLITESPASAQEQSGIDLPDLPARPFVKPGSTTPADTSLDIEDRALEEGVAAAMIAQGSAKLDSTICEYLDDEGSHEAVGMEGGGVLDAIDKPLVPVLIEMIRGRYWMNRERMMQQIYPKGYEYDITWILDAQAGRTVHSNPRARS